MLPDLLITLRVKHFMTRVLGFEAHRSVCVLHAQVCPSPPDPSPL